MAAVLNKFSGSITWHFSRVVKSEANVYTFNRIKVTFVPVLYQALYSFGVSKPVVVLVPNGNFFLFSGRAIQIIRKEVNQKFQWYYSSLSILSFSVIQKCFFNDYYITLQGAGLFGQQQQ